MSPRADASRAVCGRGEPVRPAEGRRERPDAAQSDREADVCDRAVGVAQQRRRTLQPARQKVLVRRLAERPAELTAEVRLREARRASQLRHVERLAVARVGEVLRAEQVPRWIRRDHELPITSRLASCLGPPETRASARGASHRRRVHLPFRRSAGRRAALPRWRSARTDRAAVAHRRLRGEPVDGSPAPSSAKWRMKLQLLPSVEAWKANAGPTRAIRSQTDEPSTTKKLQCRDAPGHDRDDHRLALRRVLEAELRPDVFALVHDGHARIEGPGEVDGDPRAQEEVAARGADECRRIQPRPGRALRDRRTSRYVGLRRPAAALRRERSSSCGSRSHRSGGGAPRSSRARRRSAHRRYGPPGGGKRGNTAGGGGTLSSFRAFSALLRHGVETSSSTSIPVFCSMIWPACACRRCRTALGLGRPGSFR